MRQVAVVAAALMATTMVAMPQTARAGVVTTGDVVTYAAAGSTGYDVGSTAAGSLTVDGGSRLDVGALEVGPNAGSVRVTGAGSRLVYTGAAGDALRFNSSNPGAFSIAAGGVLDVGAVSGPAAIEIGSTAGLQRFQASNAAILMTRAADNRVAIGGTGLTADVSIGQNATMRLAGSGDQSIAIGAADLRFARLTVSGALELDGRRSSLVLDDTGVNPPTSGGQLRVISGGEVDLRSAEGGSFLQLSRASVSGNSTITVASVGGTAETHLYGGSTFGDTFGVGNASLTTQSSGGAAIVTVDPFANGVADEVDFYGDSRLDIDASGGPATLAVNGRLNVESTIGVRSTSADASILVTNELFGSADVQAGGSGDAIMSLARGRTSLGRVTLEASGSGDALFDAGAGGEIDLTVTEGLTLSSAAGDAVMTLGPGEGPFSGTRAKFFGNIELDAGAGRDASFVVLGTAPGSVPTNVDFRSDGPGPMTLTVGDQTSRQSQIVFGASGRADVSLAKADLTARDISVRNGSSVQGLGTLRGDVSVVGASLLYDQAMTTPSFDDTPLALAVDGDLDLSRAELKVATQLGSGAITVTGDLTADGSTLTFVLDGTRGAPFLDIGGDATIADGILNIVLTGDDYGWIAGQTYDVIAATGVFAFAGEINFTNEIGAIVQVAQTDHGIELRFVTPIPGGLTLIIGPLVGLGILARRRHAAGKVSTAPIALR